MARTPEEERAFVAGGLAALDALRKSIVDVYPEKGLPRKCYVDLIDGLALHIQTEEITLDSPA